MPSVHILPPMPSTSQPYDIAHENQVQMKKHGLNMLHYHLRSTLRGSGHQRRSLAQLTVCASFVKARAGRKT